MSGFPNTEKKLRSRISSCKSALKKEKKDFGHIRDGSGKRYMLFYFYFALNDLDKAQEYFEWYKNEFSDDAGEPVQKLCWALSLHRMGKDNEARYKLAELMLSNLYMIPYLIGEEVTQYDMWHSSNYTFIDYIEDTPEEVIEKITESDIQWMRSLFVSSEFSGIKKRYIEIYHELEHAKGVEERSKLLGESRSLLDVLPQ